MICGPNFECDARDLISQCRLVAWDFDHLILSQRCFAPFQDSVELSPQIDLSNGFEIYSKRHSETKSIRIKIRRLERDHGPLRFLAHSLDRKAMQQLIAWKSKQYKRTGSVVRAGGPRSSQDTRPRFLGNVVAPLRGGSACCGSIWNAVRKRVPLLVSGVRPGNGLLFTRIDAVAESG